MIVVSILLAFGIDAAWATYGERQHLDQLKTSMAADVLATREAVSVRRMWADGVTRGARSILEGIKRGETGPALDSLVFTVGNVFVKGLWAPINHTYEQALSSGDLSLVREPDLRFLLGRYAEALESVEAVQRSVITQYYAELEPYMVANTEYAEVAWDVQKTGLVSVGFSTHAPEVAAQREFANLLNLKLELELEMLEALRIAEDLSTQLLEKLGSE